jgi:hypothetical protein
MMSERMKSKQVLLSKAEPYDMDPDGDVKTMEAGLKLAGERSQVTLKKLLDAAKSLHPKA